MKLPVRFLFAMLFAAMPAFAQGDDLPPGLDSLVEAERSFARTSVAKGTREAFLAFFAKDGIKVYPHPVRVRKDILSRPAPAILLPVMLNWTPIYADISQGGDLGYTTGPFVLNDRDPATPPSSYGYYFSVWKRQDDGTWKVVLNMTIAAPPPGESLPFQAAVPGSVPKRQAKGDGRRQALMQMDRDLIGLVQNAGLAGGLSRRLAESARIYRDGHAPIYGRDSIIAYLDRLHATMTWELLDGEMAQSGELGYTYGTYELREPDGANQLREHGYYARVWKREGEGQWRLMFDVSTPVPLGEMLQRP